jgi:copper resistance protein C
VECPVRDLPVIFVLKAARGNEMGQAPMIFVAARLMMICAAMLLSADAALAHAALKHSSPDAGSTVAESPHEVNLTFSETLEPAFSSAEVTDAAGARLNDAKAEVSGNIVRVALKPLPPGSYRVHWRAVSADTHRTEGNFTFSVSGK